MEQIQIPAAELRLDGIEAPQEQEKASGHCKQRIANSGRIFVSKRLGCLGRLCL
jgi:hypothetical protein